MKIGICDDQKEYREILAEYCNRYFYEKKIGYEIFLYDSGEEFATQRREKLDILLLDIEMNELNGIRIKEQLRKEKEDILYFKSDRKYCEIYRRKKEGYLLSNKPIHEWQEELEKYGFGKCHRSYLINFLYVDKIDKEILMQNGDKIPVSRQNKKIIQEDYRDFIWEKGR